jgi:hypothetical protein
MSVAERLDTSEKYSYHITFNIVVPLEFNRLIGEAIKSDFPFKKDKQESCIDFSLYKL